MYKAISSKIPVPQWADDRWKEMLARELFLTGKFYDHLPYPFSEEQRSDGEYIPFLNRRPSAPFNLPRSISAETRRWLWAGRNCPRLQLDDEPVLAALNRLTKESQLIRKMAEATFFGSIGSVAVTFQIRVGVDGYPRVLFDVWRAKDCRVRFNDVGELRDLRVQYICRGRSFLAQGIDTCLARVGPSSLSQPIQPDKFYWFTRDYREDVIITYLPLREGDYNPVDPKMEALLVMDKDRSAAHALGFVPGTWIQNLPGGEHPDGDCTWMPAVGTSIVLDYTLSMVPRGLWANLCPQLVLEGELLNQGEDQMGRFLIRGPSNTLQLAPVNKSVGGQQTGGGSAYLLESNGRIFTSAVEIIDAYKKLAKEQIQASRKDPDKLTTPQSGVAAQVLEEEHMGLIQELRHEYGDTGLVDLLIKVAKAAELSDHPALEGVSIDEEALREELGLLWPREVITPESFGLVEPALADVVARKLVPAEDIADWIRSHLDLPERPGEQLPEDAGMPPAPPVDPNKQAKPGAGAGE